MCCAEKRNNGGIVGRNKGADSTSSHAEHPVLTWLKLVRVYNVPIVYSAFLAGAAAQTETLSSFDLGWLALLSLLFVAAVQSFNDYEDSETDAVNASFRPIPSGAFSKTTVLWNGYVCAVLVCLLSYLNGSIAATLVAALIFLSTRWYSSLKKSTLMHHLLMPLGLASTPSYGALVVIQEEQGAVLSPLVWVAAISIFLLDINMNIVGCFKDLFDGCATDERVLPHVLGRRPAILVASVVGFLGLLVPIWAVVQGLCTWHPLLPVFVGFVLHVESRAWLFVDPSAQQGIRALKSGRLVECLVFPAVLFGVRPPLVAMGLVAFVVSVAYALQNMLQEAILPEDENTDCSSSGDEEGTQTTSDGCKDNSKVEMPPGTPDYGSNDTTEGKELPANKPPSTDSSSLTNLLAAHPRSLEILVILSCALVAGWAWLAGQYIPNAEPPSLWRQLYVPLASCVVGILSVLSTSSDPHVAGLMKDTHSYVFRYYGIVIFYTILEIGVHYNLTGLVSLTPIAGWASLVASASVINLVALFCLRANLFSLERIEDLTPIGMLFCMLLQGVQVAVSLVAATTWTEAIAVLLVRRLFIFPIVHFTACVQYRGSSRAKLQFETCQTVEYVGLRATANAAREVVIDIPQGVVMGSALLKTPILGGEIMTSFPKSFMRMVDKIILVEQMLACSSPTMVCHEALAICHLTFMYGMFMTDADDHNLAFKSSSQRCLRQVNRFLRGSYEEFALHSTPCDSNKSEQTPLLV